MTKIILMMVCFLSVCVQSNMVFAKEAKSIYHDTTKRELVAFLKPYRASTKSIQMKGKEALFVSYDTGSGVFITQILVYVRENRKQKWQFALEKDAWGIPRIEVKYSKKKGIVTIYSCERREKIPILWKTGKKLFTFHEKDLVKKGGDK